MFGIGVSLVCGVECPQHSLNRCDVVVVVMLRSWCYLRWGRVVGCCKPCDLIHIHATLWLRGVVVFKIWGPMSRLMYIFWRQQAVVDASECVVVCDFCSVRFRLSFDLIFVSKCRKCHGRSWTAPKRRESIFVSIEVLVCTAFVGPSL